MVLDMIDEKINSKNDNLEELTFEIALEKLESNVHNLEKGELTLDESLKIFEEGMRLARYCSTKLDDAEQKIQILLEKDGKLVKEDFKIEE